MNFKRRFSRNNCKSSGSAFRIYEKEHVTKIYQWFCEFNEQKFP